MGCARVLDRRDRLESPVDIDTFFAQSVSTRSVEHNQAADDKAEECAEGTYPNSAAYGGEEEGSNDHPQQVNQGDRTDDGDDRHFPYSPPDKSGGILK